MMKIAVTGPSGNVGRALTSKLLDAGAEVHLLAHDGAKVGNFAAMGARVHEGRLEDPDDVARATQGADALFWIIPTLFQAPDMRAGQRRIAESGAEAIRKNRIPRVVNLSSGGAQHETGVGPVSGLGEGEKILAGAAPNITHLRPGFFMENFLFQLDAIKGQGNIYMPVAGDIRTPMIATRDIAPVAAARLLDPTWSGHSIHGLHGPADLSLDEVAGILSRVLERPIRYVRIPAAAAREAFLQMGASPSTADAMIEMYAAWDSGRLRPEEPRTPATTTPTTLAEFAAQVLKPIMATAANR
jgi:uncharacterized protein YbjT (DUF2867 family)